MFTNQIFHFNPEVDEFLPIFSATVMAMTKKKMKEANGKVGPELTKEVRKKETESFNWTGE